MLREAFSEVGQSTSPCVVFAYTLKGWRLPSVGDPQNHSVILSREQMGELQADLKIKDDEAWSKFDPESELGLICKERQHATTVSIPHS